MKMAKLRTINVIQMAGGVLQTIESYTGDEEGVTQAEKLFGNYIHSDMIQRHETDDPIIAETIETCIENGYYDGDDDYYNVLLSWSDDSIDK